MKILMVNKFLYANGGSEIYVIKLGKYLKEQGHEVQYFGMDHPDRCISNESNQYVSMMDLRNCNNLNKIKYLFKTIYSFEAKKKIGKVLDDFQPDIVHMNNINYQLTPAIIYEIIKRHIPIVQTVHDVQIVCPNHRLYIEETGEICEKCTGGKYLNCIKEKCVHGSKTKSAVAAFESYYYHIRNTYNLVDCYICPSKFMENKIQQGGVEKSRILVMHNFSDIIEKMPRFDTSRRYIIYFGRLSVEKGIETLIKACKELPEIRFVIAGSGPLEEKIKGLSNVKFVGFKTGQELQELISNACLSLYPSECYENCPLSVIESQALGTPVLGSDLGGIKELINKGKTGDIFKAGDIFEFKNSIQRLWKDTTLLETMHKECLKQKSNTIDVYYKKLIKLYRNLIHS